MIQIIPSIAIKDGKIIRVEGAKISEAKIYDESPIDVATKLEDHGIKVVHLVDLDGAHKGSPVNYHILEALNGYTNLELDFTGGINTDGDISKAFEYGADYITAASVAVENKELFASWIISYGREKMTLGADALNGKIAYKGWMQNTDIDILEHIGYFYDRGLKYVKTTDISKEGSLAGPAFDLYESILKKFPEIKVLASGGVRSVDDIKRLNDMGVFAVIFGKAYYEGNISLKDLEQFIVKQ
ncbi:1-(5-phosphoribosyl)-5-[(5-phosphoribosylamino) methylideneamino]imidazole-4-carboxamide isomerase [Marivirga atlantica]|jgi:phosphoribosylformimino-5-aminoimidazole carboxamide ribotide isomerase|uniref:1-(5-phosphoribosyl)-5-[(5-phosphoribosylamino)methylideneamino] imidazole-4-carboxamide isomerase n=1 Tax=Marivirga atlantica TaxID=1548457 RepID=A0A937A5F6_9BACT|nr:1-(5-phosphoribosyl)-5-[(5-phosphoribosylamino)methylideneamino] imidazole-4-carboxamide isomerase [Marivirga atlantica]MBL0763930.1 1-(5-phosphoribosyl)-5-[(5-phosphoribosylamino)methylideneamino] imidazole-4-carboxamide isomerase [Marivirga atlantica]